jgi:type I restriction enzyme S subunit
MKTCKLSDVATFIRGITFTPEDVVNERDDKLVGCMRTKNVQEQLDTRDVWFLDKSFVKSSNQILKEGDILVSTANSWNLVGKACWVPALDYQCTFGGFICALRADEKEINKRYLYHWFTAAKTQSLLRSFGQKTTNISNLNLKRALDMKLMLPTKDEQLTIVHKLDLAENILRLHESGVSTSKAYLHVLHKELLDLT